jgi:hypothetical protein
MIIEKKGYKIIRYSFWKFWTIDRLEFSLPSRYLNAYEEVEKKLYLESSVDGSYTSINTWSTNLKSCVIEDIREQLSARVLNHEKLVKKAKKLSVNFLTKENNNYYIDDLNFYIIDGGIYFDSDEAIKREKILNKLGIK